MDRMEIKRRVNMHILESAYQPEGDWQRFTNTDIDLRRLINDGDVDISYGELLELQEESYTGNVLKDEIGRVLQECNGIIDDYDFDNAEEVSENPDGEMDVVSLRFELEVLSDNVVEIENALYSFMYEHGGESYCQYEDDTDDDQDEESVGHYTKMNVELSMPSLASFYINYSMPQAFLVNPEMCGPMWGEYQSPDGHSIIHR